MNDEIIVMVVELKRLMTRTHNTLLDLRKQDDKLYEILMEHEVRIRAIEKYIEKQEK